MGERGDHVLDGVADGVAVFVVFFPGVAQEAFFLLLTERTQTAEGTVGLF